MKSEPYIVSARKYRPATFRSVVGQKNLTNTLKNAIETGRLAQAYLFCGPRGVGKTSCARIFAKTINCLSPTPEGEACGHCDSCRAIEEGNSFNIVELDAASNNGVDSMRNLTEQVNTPPQTGKYRVFIIDEVHMLSSGAFNAFLKTLEEPPSYVIFILATTEKHKVLPTILSRCQIYDFKRITVEDMAEHLAYVASQEGIEAEASALSVIARKADGAMRDALSIFDQVASSTRGHVTYASTIENLNVLDYEYYFRLTEAFRTGNVPEALLIYADIRSKGFDSLYFVNGLAVHIRDLMLAASQTTLPLLEQSSEIAGRYAKQASSLPLEWYYTAMKLLNDCDQQYRTSSEKRLLVELTLIRLCQLLKPATPPFDRVDRHIPLQAVSQPVYAQPAPAAPRTVDSEPPAPTPIAQSVSPASHSSVQTYPQNAGAATPPVKNLRARRMASIRIPDTSGASGEKKATEKSGNQNTSAATETESDRNPKGTATRNREYTIEQFNQACAEFIVLHPQYRIMNSALRQQLPQPQGNDLFLAVASQPSEMQSYENDLRHLVGYLRSALGNDNIAIRPQLQETGGDRQHLLTEKEFMMQTMERNKELAQFLKDIKAELI